MKVFISQPMRDKTDEEILAERQRALHKVRELTKKDVEEIDSFFQDAPHEASPLWFLGESIKKMQEADFVIFCKDWHKYRGCRAEHSVAINYDIPYLEEE